MSADNLIKLVQAFPTPENHPQIYQNKGDFKVFPDNQKPAKGYKKVSDKRIVDIISSHIKEKKSIAPENQAKVTAVVKSITTAQNKKGLGAKIGRFAKKFFSSILNTITFKSFFKSTDALTKKRARTLLDELNKQESRKDISGRRISEEVSQETEAAKQKAQEAEKEAEAAKQAEKEAEEKLQLAEQQKKTEIAAKAKIEAEQKAAAQKKAEATQKLQEIKNKPSNNDAEAKANEAERKKYELMQKEAEDQLKQKEAEAKQKEEALKKIQEAELEAAEQKKKAEEERKQAEEKQLKAQEELLKAQEELTKKLAEQPAQENQTIETPQSEQQVEEKPQTNQDNHSAEEEDASAKEQEYTIPTPPPGPEIKVRNPNPVVKKKNVGVSEEVPIQNNEEVPTQNYEDSSIPPPQVQDEPKVQEEPQAEELASEEEKVEQPPKTIEELRKELKSACFEGFSDEGQLLTKEVLEKHFSSGASLLGINNNAIQKTNFELVERLSKNLNEETKSPFKEAIIHLFAAIEGSDVSKTQENQAVIRAFFSNKNEQQLQQLTLNLIGYLKMLSYYVHENASVRKEGLTDDLLSAKQTESNTSWTWAGFARGLTDTIGLSSSTRDTLTEPLISALGFSSAVHIEENEFNKFKEALNGFTDKVLHTKINDKTKEKELAALRTFSTSLKDFSKTDAENWVQFWSTRIEKLAGDLQ